MDSGPGFWLNARIRSTLVLMPVNSMPKNEKFRLIHQLLAEVSNLPITDDNKLDVVKRRARLIIGKVFGEKSHYLRDLSGIDFFPTAYGIGIDGRRTSDQASEERSWHAGKKQLTNLCTTMLEDLNLSEMAELQACATSDPAVRGGSPSKKVFVVHGHNESLREMCARLLEKLELQPIILHEQPNAGRTIIEKFHDYSDVGFAVVLLTGDDLAITKGDDAANLKLRARQNVILELGFFLAKLGRSRVCAIYEPDVELPSDYDGVLFVKLDSAGAWRFQLCRELKAADIDVDLNKAV